MQSLLRILACSPWSLQSCPVTSLAVISRLPPTSWVRLLALWHSEQVQLVEIQLVTSLPSLGAEEEADEAGAEAEVGAIQDVATAEDEEVAEAVAEAVAIVKVSLAPSTHRMDER